MTKDNSSGRRKTGKNVRREELLSLLRSSNWFVFYRDFCYVMKHTEALFYQDLINKYATAAGADVDGEGYFRCTVGYLDYPPMFWTEDLQRKLIPSLEAKGYLKKKTSKTAPPMRWIYLDVEKVLDDIRDATRNHTKTPRRKLAVNPDE
jgi:hypothetical protein